MKAKILAVYDEGEDCAVADRFTVVTNIKERNKYMVLCLSLDCHMPNGYSQWDSIEEFNDDGFRYWKNPHDLHKWGEKKITFEELPKNVQKHVLERLKEE